MDISINDDIETVSLLDKSRDLRLETLENSIKRAIQTPLGYLSLFTLDQQGLNYIDSSIGSTIYELLAEPFTSDFIYEVQSAIYQAVEFSDLSIEISNINFQILDLNSINVTLEIKDLLLDGELKIININL